MAPGTSPAPQSGEVSGPSGRLGGRRPRAGATREVDRGAGLFIASAINSSHSLSRSAAKPRRFRAQCVVRHAPTLVEGDIKARCRIVGADDLNGDGRADLAVFDAGAYVGEHSVGYGNPPRLFPERPRQAAPAHRMRSPDAVRCEHERDPPVPPASGPSDLHLNVAMSGDIDGDIDLCVESGGGANVDSHLVVNNGDGTSAVGSWSNHQPLDVEPRPPLNVYGRFYMGHFADLDHDGDSDLVFGRLRPPTSFHQSSLVLVNDGAGYFPDANLSARTRRIRTGSRAFSASPTSTSIDTTMSRQPLRSTSCSSSPPWFSPSIAVAL